MSISQRCVVMRCHDGREILVKETDADDDDPKELKAQVLLMVAKLHR